MKTYFKALVCALLLPQLTFGAVAAGDIRMSQRNPQNTNYADIVFATGNNSIIGTNATGIPSLISIGSGLTLASGVLTATGNGTGNITGSTMTANAVILGNGTNSIKALSSLGTAGQVLVSAGAGAPPAFGQITLSNTTTFGGTLPASLGGTGVSTITSGSVVIGNGTGAITTIAPGTSGNVLTSNGTAWTSAVASGGSANITAGNGITATPSGGNIIVATTVREVVVADTTGATDASAGFNTAINAVAAAGGGTVFVPYGTYKVSGISGERILLKGGVRLDFAAGTTISTGNHTAASVVIDINTSTAATIRNVVIDGNGLTITGNRTSTFSQYGIQINGQTSGDVVSGITIRNVKVANVRTDGITIGGNSGAQPSNILVQNLWVDNAYRNGGSAIYGTQIAFVDCRFTGTTGAAPGAGFDVEPDTGLSVTDIYFTRCQFTSNAGNGLYAQTALVNRVTVTDCQAVSNGSNGIVINLPAGDAVITGSVARSNTSDGIYVEALNATVTGCISASNGGDGFKAAGSNAATYTNCEAYSNTLAGFDILYSTLYSGTQNFVGCSAHDNTTRGVSFNGAVQASFTGGSVYKNATDGVQFYGAQNCILANNYIAQNGTGTDLGGDNVIVENNSLNNQITGNKLSQALKFFAGTATAGGSTTVTLPATRYTLADDYYNGMTVRITGGTGSGQTKTISDYVASTGVVTVGSSWSTNPDNTSTLEIAAANRPRYGIRLNSSNNSNQVVANDAALSGGTGTISDAGTSNVVADFTGLTIFGGNFSASGTGTFGGLVLTPASTTSSAGLRLPPGTAPSSPTNGDLWTTSAGVYAQVAGSTVNLTSGGTGNVTGLGTTGNITVWSNTTNVTTSNMTYGASNGGTFTLGNVTITGNGVFTTNTINVTDLNVTNPIGLAAGGTGFSSTTKGNIIVGNNTTTYGQLGVGTNGQVLTANSSATLGVEWSTVSGSGNVTGSSLTSGSLVIGGGSNAISVTTTGTGVVTALGLNANAAGGVVTTNGTATLTAKQNLVSGALGTDDTWEGTGITGLTAGATIAQWEAVYVGGSSTYLLADANGSGTYPAIGLAVAAYSSTDAAVVITKGTVRNDAWNWTVGGRIYLSTTAGGLTQTAPSTSGDKVQQVGWALTADIAYFDFASGEYVTVQ